MIHDDPLAKQFGRNVTNARRRAGLSQTRLATRAGVHLTTIQKIEYGKRSVRLRNLIQLAEALGIDPCLLLEGLRP